MLKYKTEQNDVFLLYFCNGAKIMNKSSGVSYLRETERHSINQDSSHQATIDSLCTSVSRDIIEMLQTMFDGIDDSFFELANNARTNNEQNQFFEAMREIRIKRKFIESTFEQKIQTLFSNQYVKSSNSSQTPIQHDTGIDSLSLVQNEDLEEEVAISSMANKARSNFQGPLLQFHARIGKLYGATELSEITPPLDPKDISEAFLHSCSKLEIELKERLIVFKQFDRYVLSNLDKVLEGANKQLIRMGIMPSLKTPGIRPKHGPKGELANSQTNAASTPTSNTKVENSPPLNSHATQNILPQLQALLANIRTQSSHRTEVTEDSINHQNFASNSADTNYDTTFIETQDLISLLGSIQSISTQSASSSHKTNIIDIRSELRNELNKDSTNELKQPAFNQIDEDLINLVAMLFEFILDDYNLAAPIQVLISRLQIPILKVVIKDNSFFSSNRHPARQLLNALAKSGIGWTEPLNGNNDALYDKINDTVHSVLNDYDGDISLFEKLCLDFNQFIKREERKSKIVEQRTKESEVGQIKSRQAQKIVEETLSSIFKNTRSPIPDIVVDTLKNGWSRVMFLAFLKDDQEHQWQRSCKTAEDLVWCIQPLVALNDRQRWISIAPKLLKELKSGLQEVSYNASGIDATTLEIRTALTNSFKNNIFKANEKQNTVDQAQTNNTQTSSIDNKSAVEKQIDSIDSELEKYLSQVEQMETGTWFEFSSGNSIYRCKLSTIINEADCFIFVNRMGLKTFEKSKIEFAKILCKKQAVALEQGLLMDRAMDALTSSLRQKASA